MYYTVLYSIYVLFSETLPRVRPSDLPRVGRPQRARRAPRARSPESQPRGPERGRARGWQLAGMLQEALGKVFRVNESMGADGCTRSRRYRRRGGARVRGGVA